MVWLIIGVLVLAGLIYLLQRAANAETSALVRRVRMAGAVLSVIAGIGLALTGRIGLAVVLFGFAAGLLGLQGLNPIGWQRPGGGGRSSGPPPRGQMSRDEALDVLGLRGSPSSDEIKSAHRRLMAKVHPDHEGSTYLASKINQAKDVLLGK